MSEEEYGWKMRVRGSGSSKRRRRAARVSMPPYEMPHKYLPLVRGIPIRNHEQPYQAPNEVTPLAVPIEIQNSIAYHLEMVGLVHVIDLKNMANEDGFIHVDQLPKVYLKHVAPEHGPDIQLNPGTWMPADQAEKAKNMKMSAEIIEPANVSDIESADYQQLQALERRIREEKIKRLREQNVDYNVKVNEGLIEPVEEEEEEDGGVDDVT